ncbi:MAG: hypothetical protein K6F63_09240 [Lachnospiraceae bacterium]|nr:hypothetical protein [Lachnospiraceae bacterium]
MKMLWDCLDKKRISLRKKYAIAILVTAGFSALFGTVLMLIVGLFTSLAPESSACFIGYPVVIGVIVVFVYGFNHE